MADTATSTVRETERKYEAEDSLELADPAGLLGLDAGAESGHQHLEAVYFDTPDLRLLRAKITLRRREGGHDEGWHLKLPAGTDSRDEVRLPLTRQRTTPPAELVALTRVQTRGEPLGPVAQLTTDRQRWVLLDTNGRDVVELVEDRVIAQTMGSETSALSWRELEVELAEHGQRKLLDRVERALLDIGAWRSGSGSKLARVLADRLAAAGLPDTPASAHGQLGRKTAGAAVLDYLGEQIDTMRTQDPLVRQDAPDAVHQMRVAARRTRSALQAYGRVLDRGATGELTDELKWLGTELADARDSEVIDQRLTGMVDELPDELVLGPVGAQLTRSMQRRRVEGQARALAALDSERYLRLHGRLDQLLAEPPLTRRARRPARRELAKGLAKAFRRTDTRMRAAQALGAGPERDAALHETRKAAKRLRYAAELAAPRLGKPAARLASRAKKVHKVLGNHQDAVVARPVIRDLAANAHLDGGNGFTYGLLHGAEARRAAGAERDLGPVWAKLSKPKTTKWLKR